MFALQNFKRPSEECEHLFGMLRNHARDFLEKEQLSSKNIKVQFIGDRSYFPQDLKELFDHIEQMTKMATGLHLNLLFCYGAQEEIVNVCQKIAYNVVQGIHNVGDITKSLFESYLWTHDTPFPDLIIRTGKTHRLSNFLLYQAAYSELYFSDCLWPEIDYIELEKAYAYFETCARNFGK